MPKLKNISPNDKNCALICHSGNRSLEVGNTLLEDRLKNIFHIDTEFEDSLDENHHRCSINDWRFNRPTLESMLILEKVS